MTHSGFEMVENNTMAKGDEPMCGECFNGFVCTRIFEHEGPHEAHDVRGRIMESWLNE